jgi:hypothetical protein
MHQSEDQDTPPIGSDFNEYLGQLGSIPSPAEWIPSSSAIPTMETQNMQLGDWVSGNQNIIGFLEEDFPGIGP